jgi:hypothetical protein
MRAPRARNAAIVTEGLGEAEALRDMPRALVFVIAVMCGLFLALAVHIALTGAGFGLTSIWREVFPTSTVQVKSALAWWTIGAAACLGSWGTIQALRKTSARLPLHRFLRLALAGVFFCVLAAAGHTAAATPGVGVAITAGANFAALSLGAFMAFCAAHFSIDR